MSTLLAMQQDMNTLAVVAPINEEVSMQRHHRRSSINTLYRGCLYNKLILYIDLDAKFTLSVVP